MIKQVNYKPNRCLYRDLKIGETFRYDEDEVGEIIYLSKSGPVRLSTGDLITDFNEYDEVIRFDITINIE